MWMWYFIKCTAFLYEDVPVPKHSFRSFGKDSKRCSVAEHHLTKYRKQAALERLKHVTDVDFDVCFPFDNEIGCLMKRHGQF